MKVTIEGEERDVVLPASFAARRELVFAWMQNKVRGAYAILGACVPSLELSTTPADHRFDWLSYGGGVYDALGLRGVLEGAAVEAATPIALELITDAFPAKDEIDEKADFSEAQQE